MAVAGQEYDVPPGDLAVQQRRRGLAVGGANDFAVGDGERGQAGKPAATDDGEHGLAIEKAGWPPMLGTHGGHVPVVTLLDLGYSCQFMTLSIFVVDR